MADMERVNHLFADENRGLSEQLEAGFQTLLHLDERRTPGETRGKSHC